MSELMDTAVLSMPYDMAMEDELTRKQFYHRAQLVLAELEEARAALAAIRSAAVPDEWREAVQNFVERCENGSIRSRYTYAKFKALLAATPAQQSEQGRDRNAQGFVEHARLSHESEQGDKHVNRDDLRLDLDRGHLLNEAAVRADYFFRQTDGSYKFPSLGGQVSQLIEMLLAAANLPADKPAVAEYVTASQAPNSQYAKGWNDCVDYMRTAAPSHSQQSEPAVAVPDERSHLIALLGVMCGWFEDLAKIAGWTPDNANAAWAGYRAAKAAIAPSQPAPAAVPDSVKNALSDLDKSYYRQWRRCFEAGDRSPSYVCGDINTVLITEIVEWARSLANPAKSFAVPDGFRQSARSSQDYAIEHAEYMAVNGEQLIDYLNEIANEDDSVLAHDDRFSDYVSGLRSGIYEFRKRRDRCPSHESEPAKEFSPHPNYATDCAVAAIEYALANDEPVTFLSLWMQGEFDALRGEWENIPNAVFIGADPLFRPSPCASQIKP